MLKYIVTDGMLRVPIEALGDIPELDGRLGKVYSGYLNTPARQDLNLPCFETSDHLLLREGINQRGKYTPCLASIGSRFVSLLSFDPSITTELLDVYEQHLSTTRYKVGGFLCDTGSRKTTLGTALRKGFKEFNILDVSTGLEIYYRDSDKVCCVKQGSKVTEILNGPATDSVEADLRRYLYRPQVMELIQGG